MMNKLLLLGIMFSLVLSLGVVIACGDDDDDDDDDTLVDDDDTAGDDDAVVEDLSCAEAYAYLYDTCEFVLEDEAGAIPVEDLTAWCEGGEDFYSTDLYDCINDNQGDCTAIADCIGGLLG